MSIENFRTVFAPFALLLLLVGCDRQGPLERAGEQVDEAVEDVRAGAEAAGDKIDDVVDDVVDAAEEAEEN